MVNGKKVVYFNHWFSAIYNTIRAIKDSPIGDTVSVIGSSKNENVVYKNIVDKFRVEPDDTVSELEYVNWLLEVGKEEKVDVFFVKRGMKSVAYHKKQFEEIGVQVICDDYNALETLEDKEKTYRRVVEPFYTPDYTSVEDYVDFERVLTKYIYKYGKAVVKKACDEGGQSVRVVSMGASSDTYKNGFTGLNISIEDMLTSYKLEGERNNGAYPKVIVMQYLTDEVSVDCYRGTSGQFALPRYKNSKRIQEMKRDNSLEKRALEIGKILKLKCPYNVQFRKDKNGHYKVIDINARMSGGIHIASQCGINIPIICLCDALRKDCEVPEFKEVKVVQIETAITL